MILRNLLQTCQLNRHNWRKSGMLIAIDHCTGAFRFVFQRENWCPFIL